MLEQSPRLGEIGAGIQLGPNAFAAFDALGVGEQARGRAVYIGPSACAMGSSSMPAMSSAWYATSWANDRTPERFYDAREWLYGWQAQSCLAA